MNKFQRDKRWCVYIHTNKLNNKVYIGITNRKPEHRWGKNGSKYNKKQPAFYNAIQKYGWDNFEHIIFADNLTEHEAKHMEIMLIALYKSNCCKYKNPEYGYNMTDGGDINPMQDDHRWTGNANPNYGNLKLNGENNPMFGISHSDDAKEKVRKANSKAIVQLDIDGAVICEYSSISEASEKCEINRCLISRCCRGLAETAGGWVWKYKTNKCNKRKSRTPKPVVQLSLSGDFICSYNSIKEAAIANQICNSNISRCCANTNKRSTGGFRWMYLEDYEQSTQQND